MGRTKLPERHQTIVRIPKDLYLEMILLNPQMQGDISVLRYGAINQYIVGLIRQDVAQRKEVLSGQATAAPPTSI